MKTHPGSGWAKRALWAALMLGTAQASWAQASPGQSAEPSFAQVAGKFLPALQGAPGSEMLVNAAQAVGHLKKMELPQASRAINEALQLDARNSYLHFFNGFIYHLQARQGDTQKGEMAIEGYQQALRIDPSNWIAQEFLALSYLDRRQYGHAKEQFAGVLLMSPESAVSQYGLMVASYMTGDPAMACALADQYRRTVPTPPAGFVRTSIAVYASCGEFGKADAMRASYAQAGREPMDIESVDRRLNQWKTVFRNRSASGHGSVADGTAASLVQASIDQTPAAGSALSGSAPTVVAQAFMSAPAAPPAEEPEPARPVPPANEAPRPDDTADAGNRMVLVDVVLVATQELITTAKGINLLNALTLQLGSASSAAFSRTYSNTAPDPATVITRALTIPALAYSLNIANASSSVNEVLARPTLAAMDGQPSEFFSGTNLNAAVVSTNSLGNASAVPVDKRFGVKLAITPAFLPNGMVKLKVDAQRTFLNANVDTAGFAYRLEISETSVNANVAMKLGDTLVLSGLSEKESSGSRTGVPLLQEVPGVQYLFSSKRTSDYQHSVLMLITPRMPIYTSQAGHAGGAGSSEALTALREKFGFSARTPSNTESILNHLKTTTLFRDFRQGDVSLERWDRMHSTGDRLRQALQFLYY